MGELKRWAGYRALNRPLTVMGVERRLFLLAATLGLGLWNATASLVAGALVFAACACGGWLIGRADPAALSVLRAAAEHPARYDPGAWDQDPWHVVVRPPDSE